MLSIGCELRITFPGMDFTPEGLSSFTAVLFKLSLDTQDNQHNYGNNDSQHKQ